MGKIFFIRILNFFWTWLGRNGVIYFDETCSRYLRDSELQIGYFTRRKLYKRLRQTNHTNVFNVSITIKNLVGIGQLLCESDYKLGIISYSDRNALINELFRLS